MATVRDIGIDVRAPKREPSPDDTLNPFNGSLPVRGSVIVGTVVSTRMQGTAVVQKERARKVQKYQRFEKRTGRYPAHVPSNIDVSVGDEVVIAECRPISKTVRFVVVENRTEGGDRPAVPVRTRTRPAAPAETVETEKGAAKSAAKKAPAKKAPAKASGEAAEAAEATGSSEGNEEES